MEEENSEDTQAVSTHCAGTPPPVPGWNADSDEAARPQEAWTRSGFEILLRRFLRMTIRETNDQKESAVPPLLVIGAMRNPETHKPIPHPALLVIGKVGPSNILGLARSLSMSLDALFAFVLVPASEGVVPEGMSIEGARALARLGLLKQRNVVSVMAEHARFGNVMWAVDVEAVEGGGVRSTGDSRDLTPGIGDVLSAEGDLLNLLAPECYVRWTTGQA